MSEIPHKKQLRQLEKSLDGTLFFDALHRSIYATDASVYRKIPLAVAYPKNKTDLQKLITFARLHKMTLIPRTAGTSLAGQCVGEGIVVDVSKHFTAVLNVDEKKRTVTLQPGVIRDDLNRFLNPYHLFFSPNTSTSNRCMIGGMVGNNSSGSTSIKYGVTRDKVLEIEALLADGSTVVFREMTAENFIKKTRQNDLEGAIYKTIFEALSKKQVQKNIQTSFPKPTIHRRNTGYAIDIFFTCKLFGGTKNTINPAKFLCGSEGTLCFFTSITLALDPLPPHINLMVCVHFHTVAESLKATLIAMKHPLYSCELMDKIILDCAKDNPSQKKNRFFLQGDPAAVLMLELKAHTKNELDRLADELIRDLKKEKFGYAYPKIYGADVLKIMTLRSAGLGSLAHIAGDKKAVACIEDTAVALEDLPAYIDEFSDLLKKYRQQAVYYAHAGAGELHLRPILNLKRQADVKLFYTLTVETAKLVKKYKGSFSGEHGDGIVRSQFIPLMIGDENYAVLQKIKAVFDPLNIFNAGKIIAPFPMTKSLRYAPERTEPHIFTFQSFQKEGGILRLAEKCNGSGDCRKSAEAGGVLCPSYRATKNEKDTTRARANALREFLTTAPSGKNPFDFQELKTVFDLCLSCKACVSECPSGVDVATLKAEFLYQYQEANGYTFQNKLFANATKINKITRYFPTFFNALINTHIIKKISGIDPRRELPKLARVSFDTLLKKYKPLKKYKHTVYFFNDEFTNFYQPQLAVDLFFVLKKIGFRIIVLPHKESGRSFLSKGFLKQAKKIADENIKIFKNHITKETPLIGIEPSAILTFRDEYLRFADDLDTAKKIAKNTFTVEEFLTHEFEKGNINSHLFTTEKKEIKIHGHCHQKALSNVQHTFTVLNIPTNYNVTILNTGCCGMAGSFGYEKQHYEVSMQAGEDTLFPKLRKLSNDVEIAAAGISCRHQIWDGVKRKSKHPITILKEALVSFV